MKPEEREPIEPQTLAEAACRGRPEVRATTRAVQVTLELPWHEREDLEWVIEPYALRVRTRDHPDGVDLRISLPWQVRSDRYIITAQRGIYEIWMQRA